MDNNSKKIYDFYFSKKAKSTLTAACNREGKKFTSSFINGKEYIEMIQQGNEPTMSNYTDLVKVGTGVESNITYK